MSENKLSQVVGMVAVVVVAEAMWLWLRRLCGCACGGYVVLVAEAMWWGAGSNENKHQLCTLHTMWPYKGKA